MCTSNTNCSFQSNVDLLEQTGTVSEPLCRDRRGITILWRCLNAISLVHVNLRGTGDSSDSSQGLGTYCNSDYQHKDALDTWAEVSVEGEFITWRSSSVDEERAAHMQKIGGKWGTKTSFVEEALQETVASLQAVPFINEPIRLQKKTHHTLLSHIALEPRWTNALFTPLI